MVSLVQAVLEDYTHVCDILRYAGSTRQTMLAANTPVQQVALSKIKVNNEAMVQECAVLTIN